MEEVSSRNVQQEVFTSPLNQAVRGVLLQDLLNYTAAHRDWFAGNEDESTMHHLCQELMIPATTCRERLVTLCAEDMLKLVSRDEGGVFVSGQDLTLDPELGGSVHLGGVNLPTNLTVHGKLVVGGTVRRQYWALGRDRDQQWQTSGAHGREIQPVSEAGPIPQHLRNRRIGEDQDKVLDPGSFQVGDTLVLRQGVSFAEVFGKVAPPAPEIHSFVSHFWGERVLDFVSALEHHARGTQGSARVYYVYAFSNSQHRLEFAGSSWAESPFARALDSLARLRQERGQADVVMVVDAEASLLQRKWCLFEAFGCMELDLPLRLMHASGELFRGSMGSHSRAVLERLRELDIETASCSVPADAAMIQGALEKAAGGLTAVHAAVRQHFLNLLTFVGSLSQLVPVDPGTGQTLQEIELFLRGQAPEPVRSQVTSSRKVVSSLCRGAAPMGRRLLLVAQAGSGKSVFTRELVRHTMTVKESSGLREASSSGTLMPIMVPLGELAEVANNGTPPAKLLDVWAQTTFPQDSRRVTERGEFPRLLILDGFDEARSRRADIMAWMCTWLKKHSDATVLLTSRPSGVDSEGLASRSIVSDLQASVVRCVDATGNQLGLSRPFEHGSYVVIDGLDSCGCYVNAKECTSGLSMEPIQLLNTDAKWWDAGIAADELDLGSSVKPGKYGPLSPRTVTGVGFGGTINLEVKQFKSRASSVITNKVVKISVVNVGQGYKVGDELEIDGATIPGAKAVASGEIVKIRWQLPASAVAYYASFCQEAYISDEGGAVPMNISGVTVGARVQQLCAREQFVKSLGFCDYEIDPIDSRAASLIVQQALAAAGSDFDPALVEPILAQLPESSWNRPMLAGLLAQYITSPVGAEQIKISHEAVTELSVFRYVVAELITEAATRTALAPDRVWRELSELSLNKRSGVEGNDYFRRDEFHAELQDFFDHALRASFRLFEPMQGENGIQFYHPRVIEVLAAQAWVSSLHQGIEGPLTATDLGRACRDADYASGLRAPLRYLFQMALANEGNAQMLGVFHSVSGVPPPCSTPLTQLDLAGSSIGPEGMKALADVLRTNTTLQKLHLAGNSMVDEGAMALAEAIRNNTALTELDLGRNSVGDAGARAIADALRCNTTLHHINLVWNMMRGFPLDLQDRVQC